MASSLFIFFLSFLTHFLPFSVLSATVLEDLATLTPPPDFATTITTNCLHNPLLRYCNNNNTSSPQDIVEIFRSTIVASHLCNESKNPNCLDSFPKIRIHSRPKTAALYLSFDFFWKFCPLTVLEIHLVNNSLENEFPTNVLSCAQVRTIDLSYNQLSGSLPVQSLSRLTNLTHLNLSYNRFSISNSEFLKRFSATSFVHSGLLPDAKRHKMKVLLIVVSIVVVILLCCCLGWLCLKRPDYLPITCRRSNKFTSAMIDAATDEFSDQRLVSKRDGVDTFRGTLRDGREAKIEVYTEKVSKEKRREFEEVCEAVFLKLRHKNLVRVLGWCNSRDLRALVTEWTDGENVETWLSSSSLASSWRRRLRVVMGVVEGLSYLSEQWPEITFDLNTSSVLLSGDGQEPLISQFKIGDGNNSSTNIFKFGLFLLEMITNLKPNEEQEDSERRYLEYIRVHCPDNVERVVDKKMKIEERTLEKVKEAITLGLMCTDKAPLKQPNFTQVYDMVVSLHESSSRHH
ncbi:Leucine-rich repeat protein kinase family protein [Raphanus sativus]|uniref:Leucine-rich repeat receptor-like serine/threonine-protein kinase At2g24130 n=1 Tax=Raphanus sativus TaxID=3726 RepID=A0A6J0NL84_RAPSA|nr:putative leucine-rich repeat receptor-like serine/threonine-protein kinase At2g24130 [Raphanus sativus]KAJ4867613.1 Leucine-rich repeat protein kinase family protein [Raphanus sativus]